MICACGTDTGEDLFATVELSLRLEDEHVKGAHAELCLDCNRHLTAAPRAFRESLARLVADTVALDRRGATKAVTLPITGRQA